MSSNFNFGLSNKAQQISVASLVIQDTGTYNTQYIRPYNCVVDGQTMNVLTDRFASHQFRNRVAPAELSDIASSILQLQPNVEAVANIDNNWNERRARFLMHVIVTFQTGGIVHFNISGYTDFLGITASSAIAPDMTFFINSINTSKETRMQTSTGISNVFNTVESTHVHSDHHWAMNGAINQPGQKRLIRPMDLYNTVGLNHVMSGMQSTGSYDTRNTLSNNATLSHRQNSLPSNYVAKVIEARLQANTSTLSSNDDESIYTAAAGNVAEPQSHMNPFLKVLGSVKNTGKIGNTFTISDILQIDPNVLNVMSYVPLSLGSRQVHQTGMTADWSGSDAVTVAASTLAHAAPAIMMSLGLARISFSTTNSTIGGVMTTIISDARSFGGNDTAVPCEIFKQRLEVEVLRDIALNGMRTYAAELTVDLLGETWIKISLDDSGIYDYVTPSFCDALLAPTITQNSSLVNSISEDFSTMVENIQTAINGNTIISFPTTEINF